MHLNERKCIDVSPKDSASLGRAEKVRGKNPAFSELQEAITIEMVLLMFFFFFFSFFLLLLLPFPCLFVSASNELIGVGAD